jgi:hypothetical protein
MNMVRGQKLNLYFRGRSGVSYQPNVIRIDGFSEAVVRFILEYEHEYRMNHAEATQTYPN